MKLWKRKPSRMLVLVAALIALLPLLAVRQFQWLGEVSQAERDRMQATLKTAVTNFSQDFDRELTRAYLSFQMDSRTRRDHDWADYARRYDQWMQNAPYPQLVAGVYLVEPFTQPDAQARLQLYGFDRPSASFAPTVWPAALEHVRAGLQQELDNRDEPAPFIFRPSVDAVDDEAMALVIPIPDVALLERHELQSPFMVTSRVIVRLDPDFVRNQMIPELAARYFTSGDRQDYRIAITSRSDPTNVIYQTENGAADSTRSAADATGALFGIRADMPVLVEGLAQEIEQSTVKGEKKERVAVRIFNMALKPNRLMVRSDQDKEVLPSRIAVFGHDGGRWLVALKHRAGSLDAAVAAARRRNLAISFGVLLLLSISIAMIVVSTRRAERLARQQMEFVAGVSHEMRTPLAVICSAGENLADGVIEESAQVRRYGALIESEGRRLSEMIEQALEFAGIQSGRKAYALQPADTAGVVESALAGCAPLIVEGGFTIEKQVAEGLPSLAADAPALSRAIQNLLNNAMKYSGDSRWIRLTAKAAPGERGEAVQITIEDRGLGIAAADLAHIFEPFYRSAEVTSAQIHGSGLGLSLVKHIVEAHGGRIRVESSIGRGSTFTVHLPALAQTAITPDEQTTLAAGEPAQSTTQKPEFSR